MSSGPVRAGASQVGEVVQDIPDPIHRTASIIDALGHMASRPPLAKGGGGWFAAEVVAELLRGKLGIEIKVSALRRGPRFPELSEALVNRSNAVWCELEELGAVGLSDTSRSVERGVAGKRPRATTQFDHATTETSYDVARTEANRSYSSSRIRCPQRLQLTCPSPSWRSSARR